MLFEHELRVTLRESDHRYFDQYEEEYTSNGQMHKCVIPKFDPDGQILKAVARRDGKSQVQVQKEWDKIAAISNDRGTLIHNNLDHMWKTGAVIDKEYEELGHSVYNYFAPRDYKAHFAEQIVFFPKKKVAGTFDLGFQRRKKHQGRPVVDIFDYKTQKDGIDSDGKYQNFYSGPLSHLMHSTFTEICLKMSTYALMCEYTWSLAIGQLGIIYIPPTDIMSWHIIPVPYMKKEVIAIVNHFSNTKENAGISV